LLAGIQSGGNTLEHTRASTGRDLLAAAVFRYITHANELSFKSRGENIAQVITPILRNILVDENNDYQVTAILDWEFAGWYPEWWEYFRASDT
jgi:hypothetical protein